MALYAPGDKVLVIDGTHRVLETRDKYYAVILRTHGDDCGHGQTSYDLEYHVRDTGLLGGGNWWSHEGSLIPYNDAKVGKATKKKKMRINIGDQFRLVDSGDLYEVLGLAEDGRNCHIKQIDGARESAHYSIETLQDLSRWILVKTKKGKKMKKQKFQVGDFVRFPYEGYTDNYAYFTVTKITDINDARGPRLWGYFMNSNMSGRSGSEAYAWSEQVEMVLKKGAKIPKPNFLMAYVKGTSLVTKEYKTSAEIKKDVEKLARDKQVDLDTLRVYSIAKVNTVKVKITV